jgi:hypothetical protein
LPASFETHQLQVAVEPIPADVARRDAAESEPPAPSWQSVIMIGAAGLLLFLVSRRYRSPSSSSEADLRPVAEAAETRNEATPAADAATPPASPQTITPLGDPELVADVLKHWLGSSYHADETGSSPPASREAD